MSQPQRSEHLSDIRARLDADEFYIPWRLPTDSGERATVEILASIERIVERVEGVRS